MTLTEVADKMGVTKSTASYHLSSLLRRGVIEEVGTKEGRGGVRMRQFGLREGSLVVSHGQDREDSELQRIRETFDLQTLAWAGSPKSVGAEEVQVLLYKMFLHLFRVTRTEHKALMLEYGGRAGALVAAGITVPPARRAVVSLAAFLRQAGLSEADVIEVPETPVSVIVSTLCLGSDYHPGHSCYFLQGMVEGMVRTKLGPAVKVGRVEVPSLSGCCFAVGRVRSLELEWLSEAVLSSPRYSAINRGRARV